MKAFLKNLFSRLTAWVHGMFSQDNGIPSSVRVLMFGWHTPAILVWTGLSIYHGKMEDVPNGLGFLLGGLTGFKVGQKFGEVQLTPPA